jgi:hypothetical protein
MRFTMFAIKVHAGIYFEDKKQREPVQDCRIGKGGVFPTEHFPTEHIPN